MKCGGGRAVSWETVLDIFRFSEKAMGMDDRSWQRHANPWSFYTRLAILPALVLVIWSRVWIGWWCVLPLLVLLAFTWWNPRAFAPPKTTDHWTSKGVMGERIFLARKSAPISRHHHRAAIVLTLLSGLGIIPLAYGLIRLDFATTLLGLVMTMGGKLWFVDRMVWLYQDTISANPQHPLAP